MPFDYKKRVSPQQPVPAVNVPRILAEKLGAGLKAPFEMYSDSRWEDTSGIDKVKQSMYLILLTPIGRRWLQPDFGSMLPYLIFEHYTTQLQREMIQATKTALNQWLPTITVEQCRVSRDPNGNNIVYIELEYIIKGTMARDSVTIPLSQSDKTVYGPRVFTINGKTVFVS